MNAAAFRPFAKRRRPPCDGDSWRNSAPSWFRPGNAGARAARRYNPARMGKTMVKPNSRMDIDRAATLALEVLAFLAADPDAFGRFAGLTGLDPASAAARAGEAEFLASVLDFLLADEPLLIDFCRTGSTDARAVHLARHVLGGP